MQDQLQKYLSNFQKLRIDRAHGIAPHKPILLLSVLQSFQNGINNCQRIFIINYDDTISNGIALCPNLHRAFDRGLIGINENYRVVISDKFKEDETNYSIRLFEGKNILLPNTEKYFPSKANLEWHYLNIFK